MDCVIKEINLICKLHVDLVVAFFAMANFIWFDAKVSLLATVGHVCALSLRKLFSIDKLAVWQFTSVFESFDHNLHLS